MFNKNIISVILLALLLTPTAFAQPTVAELHAKRADLKRKIWQNSRIVHSDTVSIADRSICKEKALESIRLLEEQADSAEAKQTGLQDDTDAESPSSSESSDDFFRDLRPTEPYVFLTPLEYAQDDLNHIALLLDSAVQGLASATRRLEEATRELQVINEQLREYPDYLDDIRFLLRQLPSSTAFELQEAERLFEGKTLDELLDILALIQEALNSEIGTSATNHENLTNLLDVIQQAAETRRGEFQELADSLERDPEYTGGIFYQLVLRIQGELAHRLCPEPIASRAYLLHYGQVFEGQLELAEAEGYNAMLYREIRSTLKLLRRQLEGNHDASSNSGGSSSEEHSPPSTIRATSITPPELRLTPSDAQAIAGALLGIANRGFEGSQ